MILHIIALRSKKHLELKLLTHILLVYLTNLELNSKKLKKILLYLLNMKTVELNLLKIIKMMIGNRLYLSMNVQSGPIVFLLFAGN